MRGTLGDLRGHGQSGGIIPAHAGNTSVVRFTASTDWDHPRACGEHLTSAWVLPLSPGSSPRMRGTHTRLVKAGRKTGIIPAHAGNTWHTGPLVYASGDHPRACGEHNRRRNIAVNRLGSSPRMRGTLPGKSTGLQTSGIIPAHAGNTHVVTRPITASRDHPRACGEHLVLTLTMLPHSGSSPRMRGTPGSAVSLLAFSGIIPAHAGNTRCHPRRSCGVRDHPRACGEHHDESHRANDKQGSSPRMRGTRLFLHECGRHSGIIPAHAGNT